MELESLVELVVDVSEPEATKVSWSSLGLLINHELDLVHLVGPDLLALEEIDIHELNHFVDNIDVNFPQLSILVDQLCRHLLHLFGVALNLNWVLPGHELLSRGRGAASRYWILDYLLEALGLLEHHRLLAVDHLSTHRVVEVGDLLQGHALLVELLGLVDDLSDLLVEREAVFANSPGILDESDQLLAVVHLEETSCLEVELHQLACHLVLLLLVWIFEHVEDIVLPLVEKASLVRADVLSEVVGLCHELLEGWKVHEETLRSQDVRVNFLGELPGPNDGADHRRHILALRWLLHARNGLDALPCPHVEVLTHLLDLTGHLGDEVLTLLLELRLDGVFAEEPFPSLEFSHELRWRA